MNKTKKQANKPLTLSEQDEVLRKTHFALDAYLSHDDSSEEPEKKADPDVIGADASEEWEDGLIDLLYGKDTDTQKQRILNFVHDLLKAQEQRVRKETAEEILRYFETMVFDNLGNDKLINIMEFRKTQSDYLKKKFLSDQPEKEGE